MRLPRLTKLVHLAALLSTTLFSTAVIAQTCIDDLAVRSRTGQIALTWTHVEGTDVYNVQRATAAAGPWSQIDSTTSEYSAYVDDTVTNGTLYYYRIERVAASSSSCTSDAIAGIAPASRTRMASVPDIVGEPEADADAALTAAALAAGTIASVHSDTVDEGVTVSQDPPAGSAVPQGYLVDFDVSLGPDTPTTTDVPDVVGQSQAAAETAITDAGFAVGAVTTANSDTVPEGDVISQNPSAGALAEAGSAVDLVVSSGPAPVTVPDVVGQAQASAETAITDADLAVGAVTTANSDTVPEGDVISQNPTAGTLADRGSAVDLVVSSGPAPVAVPDVVGQVQTSAETAITDADLAVGAVTEQNSDTVPEGDVISQDPAAGTLAEPGSAVDLVVSTGPADVSVPDVVGQSQTAAETAITDADLAVGTVTEQNSDTVPEGTVMSQSPVAGTLAEPGSTVDLVVSAGPADVSVPDVVGQTQAAAETAITSAGLVVGSVTEQSSDTVAEGDVMSQDPAAGALVAPGSAVDLVVSSGPADADEPAELSLSLSQNVVNAADDITVTPEVLDGAGDPIDPSPGITYSIDFVPAEAEGTAPSESGGIVTTAADTRGVYTVNGTVDGTSVTSSADFVVLRPAAESEQKALYAGLSESLNTVDTSAEELVEALDLGDTAAMQAAVDAMRSGRDAVDRAALQRSTAFAPETGFLPTPAELTAAGFPETADDAALDALLDDIIAKVDEIADYYGSLDPASSVDDDAELAALNTELQTLVDELEALDPTVHGWVKSSSAINRLLAVSIPQHLHEVVGAVETAFVDAGLVTDAQRPGDFYRDLTAPGVESLAARGAPASFYAERQDAFFSLSGMSTAVNVQMRIINNVYVPIMKDIARNVAILAANDLLNAFVNNAGISALKTGSSFSAHVFNQPNSFLEVVGANAEFAARNDVYVVGPNAITAVEDLVTALDPGEIESLDELYDYFEGIIDAINGAGEAYEEAHQVPEDTAIGCVLGSSDPNCVQLEYPTGIDRVADCSGFFCTPASVLILYHNLDTGTWAFEVYNFLTD